MKIKLNVQEDHNRITGVDVGLGGALGSALGSALAVD